MDISNKTIQTVIKALNIAKHTITLEYTKGLQAAAITSPNAANVKLFLETQTSLVEMIDAFNRTEKDFQLLIIKEDDTIIG
jgi:hypothetical protein